MGGSINAYWGSYDFVLKNIRKTEPVDHQIQEGCLNNIRHLNNVKFNGAKACQAVYDCCDETSVFIQGHEHFNKTTFFMLPNDKLAQVKTIHSTDVVHNSHHPSEPEYGVIENGIFNFHKV